jgi:hypothetical protein
MTTVLSQVVDLFLRAPFEIITKMLRGASDGMAKC